MDFNKQGFLVSECSRVLRSWADIVRDRMRRLVDCAVSSGSCSPTYRKLKRNRGITSPSTQSSAEAATEAEQASPQPSLSPDNDLLVNSLRLAISNLTIDRDALSTKCAIIIIYQYQVAFHVFLWLLNITSLLLKAGQSVLHDCYFIPVDPRDPYPTIPTIIEMSSNLNPSVPISRPAS